MADEIIEVESVVVENNTVVEIESTDTNVDDLTRYLEQTFNLYDENGDGLVTAEDLKRMIEKFAQNPTDEPALATPLEDLIKKLGANDYGTINLSEFMKVVKDNINDINSEESLKDAFNVFDKDQTGFISTAQVRDVMMNFGLKWTDDEVDEMIKEADTDGDGQVNYEDFAKMMLN